MLRFAPANLKDEVTPCRDISVGAGYTLTGLYSLRLIQRTESVSNSLLNLYDRSRYDTLHTASGLGGLHSARAR
jgi:hypothetical protein